MTTTSAGTFSSSAERRHESWLIALVSAAHFISHYYIILLAPLFVFIRADYGVSYTELGFAFVAFNVVTALLQTPAGFLVDRIGAKPLLVAGVVLGAVAIAVAALVDSFWIFVAMFGVAGLANTVYHPADYTLRPAFRRSAWAALFHPHFRRHARRRRPGESAADPYLRRLARRLLGAALLGFIIAAVLALSSDLEARRSKADKASDTAAAGDWRLVFLPILQAAFFVMLAIANAGLQELFVVALGALFGRRSASPTPPCPAICCSPPWRAPGGLVASVTNRHAGGRARLCAAALALHDQDRRSRRPVPCHHDVARRVLTGVIMPSRDLIVRRTRRPDPSARFSASSPPVSTSAVSFLRWSSAG